MNLAVAIRRKGICLGLLWGVLTAARPAADYPLLTAPLRLMEGLFAWLGLLSEATLWPYALTILSCALATGVVLTMLASFSRRIIFWEIHVGDGSKNIRARR